MSINKTTEIFGYLGATCLTITLLPQIYHTIKTKKVDDISFGFIALQIITCILFLIYGIRLKEKPLIIANSLVGIQIIIFLCLKILFR